MFWIWLKDCGKSIQPGKAFILGIEDVGKGIKSKRVEVVGEGMESEKFKDSIIVVRGIYGMYPLHKFQMAQHNNVW